MSPAAAPTLSILAIALIIAFFHHLRGDDPVSEVDVEDVHRSVVGGEGGDKERVTIVYEVEGYDPVVEAGIDVVGAVLFADCDGGVERSQKWQR